MAKRFKGDIQVENDLQVDNNVSLPSKTASRALEIDGSGNVESSSVTSTELGHVSGVTSAIQTQIDSKAADADVIKKDGSVDFTGDQSMNSNKLTNLAAPTSDNDAARKIDVDNAAAGITSKESVVVASTADIGGTYNSSGGTSGNGSFTGATDVIDGVTLTGSERILLKDQTDAKENGIYDRTGSGAYERSSDFDASPASEVTGGSATFVTEGTANINTMFRLTGTGDKTLNTDDLDFIVYSRAEAIVAGDGIDKSGLTISVDSSDIAGTGLEESSNNLRISSSAAGTGLTGGSGTALSVDFGTSGSKAVSATDLASNSGGEGAALIGIEDSAGDYTSSNVEGALVEIQTSLDGKQSDVITTEGDLVIGNGSGEESKLAIGTNGQVLQSDGSTASWQSLSTADEQVKVSANDTNEKYLEDAIVVSSGTNTTNPLELSTLNDGANEDLQIQFDEAKVDHDALNNFVADEHVDHSSVNINTNADSGLSGGGDITTSRTLSVDINGTTAEATVAGADEILIYDASVGALRKMTRDNFVGTPGASSGDISETSFSGANNQASAANVTGFAFANGTVRSFQAHVSIVVDATADLYETYQIEGIQKGSDWDISQASTGDDSNVNFSITSAGQIQYTSDTYAGFSSLTIKFRAITTSV